MSSRSLWAYVQAYSTVLVLGIVILMRVPFFSKYLRVLASGRGGPARTSAANPLLEENDLPGTDDWMLTRPAFGREIEGYASVCSASGGQTVELHVNTASPSYTIQIFRMGWYGGRGARRILGPVTARGLRQPIPGADPETGLIDCDWQSSFRLAIGADWRSGVYLAKLEESAGHCQSYVVFVVTDHNDHADVVFELPVNTYQAYNFWGGRSAYAWGGGDAVPWGSTPGRQATVISFNRPYAASTNPAAAFGMGAGEFLCNVQPVSTGYPISSAGWDYNLVRWLEREGYNVTYVTNVDVQNFPGLFNRRRVFISGAHDEYWSWQGRANLELALTQGTNLFFSGANAIYWQVRPERDRHGRADRLLAIYKEQTSRLDPVLLDKDPSNDHLATTQWRLPPVSRPEDMLIGVCYLMDPVDGDIVVSDANHWAFANTGVVNGSELSGLLGYEIDGLLGNAPDGLRVLAASLAKNLHDPSRTVVSNMAAYVAPSGAEVFATGSMQWSWGLDDFNAPNLRTSRLSPAAAQITHNVLKRFGAKRYSA
jgi:hypothetical protein